VIHVCVRMLDRVQTASFGIDKTHNRQIENIRQILKDGHLTSTVWNSVLSGIRLIYCNEL
jgi:hypothetical protein